MKIISHQFGNTKIAEINSQEAIIREVEDGLQLLADLYYQGFDSIILHEVNFSPVFFNLKSGMAGEILQKFSNFRTRLAIVGDFEQVHAKSLKAFISESNKTGNIIFTATVTEAIEKFSDDTV